MFMPQVTVKIEGNFLLGPVFQNKILPNTRAVTNPKKNSDPDPNPNEVYCRISDPDPKIYNKTC